MLRRPLETTPTFRELRISQRTSGKVCGCSLLIGTNRSPLVSKSVTALSWWRCAIAWCKPGCDSGGGATTMGMEVAGKKGGPTASMNVVPLIDILLVLLIIFMVIT